MGEILFYIVILLSNLIQGITGFAGTILAMPFCIILKGFEVAKPVLNVLGILAPLFVLIFNFKKVQWKEFFIIIAFMIPSMIAGIFLGKLFAGKAGLMYKILGIFVIVLAIIRTIKLFTNYEENQNLPTALKVSKDLAYLISSGLIHGMFVCGGPLLVGYLSGKLKDKDEFRATISTVWILLNSMIFVVDLQQGLWVGETVRIGLISIPFMFVGVAIGGILCKRMSQKAFLILTYILFVISGISLLIK